MNKKFLIDLDETLIPTNQHYNNAMENFYNFVSETFNNSKYSFDDIFNKHVESQSKLIDRFGFNTEVFPRSLKNVYLDIAKEFSMNQSKASYGSNFSYKIGKSVFDEKKWIKAGIYSNVGETLDFLVDNGVDLEMITLGDSIMQKKKVRVMGLDKWFSSDKVHVVLKEKGSKIRELSSDRNKGDIYFVGDSYDKDIFPSLQAGINGIYIPQKITLQSGSPNKAHPRLIQLEKFSDIKRIYNYLP